MFLKISSKLLLLLAFVSIVACSKKEDISPFAGSWKGTYTGANDNGKWDAVINADGSATGNIKSTPSGLSYVATGQVASNGQFTLTAGTATSGAVFTGILSGTNATGSWVNNIVTPNYTGTWSGTKQ